MNPQHLAEKVAKNFAAELEGWIIENVGNPHGRDIVMRYYPGGRIEVWESGKLLAVRARQDSEESAS